MEMTQNISEFLIIQTIEETYFYMAILSIKSAKLVRLGARYLILTGTYSSANARNLKVGLAIVEYFGNVNSSTTNLTASVGFDIPINQTGGLIKVASYFAGWGL